MKTLTIIAAFAVLAVSTTANAWGPNDNNGNGYQPQAATPLTAEEMIARRAAFEKAQKEAFERHQEAIKKMQTRAPAAPSQNAMPADMQARRDAFVKDMEERRAANDKRRQAMPTQARQEMPAEMQARRDAFQKDMKERRAANDERRDAFRAAAEKRREEMMKKYNESRTSDKAAENS